MFDTIVNPSSGVPRQRWTTTMLSAVGHVAVMIVLVLSTLYATDALPEPRETMAFFVAAPVPPPNMYSNDIALIHIVDDGPRRPRDPQQIRPIELYQGPPPGSGRTTKAGRSRFSLPRP